MTPEEYIREAARRMVADGSRVSDVQLPGGPAVIGYQSQFRVRWFATKLHLFLVIVSVPVASQQMLADVTGQSIEYAKKTKGSLRGLQTGVAALPVLVTPQLTPDGRAAVEARPSKGWAALVLPTIVDTTSGSIYRYQGRLIWGGIYASWLRSRLQAALPYPTSGDNANRTG